MKQFDFTKIAVPKEQSFTFDTVRLSVISNRILRVEQNDNGIFCDNATQLAVCRNLQSVATRVRREHNFVVIATEKSAFRVNLSNLQTEAKIGRQWVLPSNRTNLGGTARTLDGTVGILGGWKSERTAKDRFMINHIRKGIFSSNGVAEIDDSDSFIFNEDGSVSVRNEKCTDKYIFAFGDDYFGGLKEFYSLCGKTPLLPKYVFGNWWSRYHAYTQQEYIELFDKFEQKKIPFTVATIDMDWHIVKNVPKDVKDGWTGYTFEKELFPDYKAFFKNLKNRNLAITMNLHPHDGVRYFEEQYDDMCKAVGQNPDEKKPVKFNLLNERFRKAYFDILHHPYENDGVDFWWIDWQQGTSSKEMQELDPLWLLNHYHYSDSKSGMILSRYAGLGSHRYPVGFSGDTVVCWKSLALQPWFTSNASNAGYTWWSHDIGGHLLNSGNNELYLRWLQFGVFSPVNRLHSNNVSISKEPWNFPQVEETAKKYLRLRHRLIPYLYSANVETSENGTPLICPMYYRDKSENAYSEKYKNQYYFGSELIVVPVTRKTKAGKPNVKFYLPDGEWTDIFTDEKYSGGEYEICCPIERIPVFAKAGAIIPMLPEADGNSTDFDELCVTVYYGENTYTLYDDDGEKIIFKLDKDELTVSPSANCKTKRITVIYKNCNKDKKIIEL